MFENYSVADLVANIYKKRIVNIVALVLIFCMIAVPYTYKALSSKTIIKENTNYSSYVSYKITSPVEEQQNFNKNKIGGYGDFYGKLIESNLNGAFLFNDLTPEDMEAISDFVLDKSNNANVIILDTMLNRYNSIADKVLVITDGIKSYFGNLEDLLILKQLTAINISDNEKLDDILSGYQYTIYHDNEIVVREEVLEEVVYSLLKNNIEVYQIRNLGEKIKLYEGEDDL